MEFGLKTLVTSLLLALLGRLLVTTSSLFPTHKDFVYLVVCTKILQ